ncbi:type III secretion system inner membrane ring lipoprotein SctJ [Pseudomonas matsuisoli]|uniref:Lipoprotein n=1 Tax=Pseudomonas matsuisoli TaxID=1515666 RepID=A0A917PPA0_9PSED|nr:type III secretion inner membrane ring lipoprotein SctJ [Pseudomonas matsuisoli]GGJ85785.1 EscJ/YscJ/HrcJ family type III secretion inner membrane ring protein [Pseudomonas matsuisoli]
MPNASFFTRPHIMRSVLVVMLALVLQGCDTELYSGLQQREANRIVSTLLGQGISADRVVQKDGTLTVTVDKARFAEAMTLLEAAGLPEQKFANLGDVFQSNGLVSSPVQEKAQMIYALSEELSHTVSQVDGVLSARVHVVLPDNDLLRRDAVPSSASVFIRYEPNLDINRLIPQVKTLVANGISGLGYDGVSVIPVEAAARPSTPDAPLTTFMGMTLQENSIGQARMVFGGLLLLVLGLGVALSYVLYRRPATARTYPLTVQ